MEKKILIETKRATASDPREVASHKRPERRVIIPRQLQRPEFRFVLIPRAAKAPCEKKWTTVNNYRFDDPKLVKWLQRGGNYGVCCGFGDLVGIDADDPIIAEIFETHFGPTFRVRSGSGRGFHDYIVVQGFREKLLFERNGKHLGEAQSRGQQLVGPGSIHPSGGTYTVVGDLPILEIDSATFLKVFEKISRSQPKITAQPRTSFPPNGLQNEFQSLPLVGLLSIRGVRRGEEVHGPNPWHGSTTGHNFSLNTVRNVWHCFRCNAGGGVCKAIALNAGIISRCDDVLSPVDFRRVLQIVHRFPSGSLSITERRCSNMEEEINLKETATMCPTKAGHGFKVVFDGVWFYASKRQVLEMINGQQKACTFHTIKDEPLAEVVSH